MTLEAREICRSVLEKIVPSEEERARVDQIAARLATSLRAALEESHLEGEPVLQGSVAKDTWLRTEVDVDIFILVPLRVPRNEIESNYLSSIHQALKKYPTIERYAEHPYVESHINGVRVNVVPCYKVLQGKWLSATDRTPFHTDYMRKRLTADLRNEVRLLKAFTRGTGVYGAEIRTSGFSGMLCEILVAYFGGFLKTLEAAAEWKSRVLIDIEGFYRQSTDDIPDLFDEKFIVVDPTDKYRNVAAAVSGKRLWEFVASSRRFLDAPAERFFFPSRQTNDHDRAEALLKKRGSTIMGVSFGKIGVVVDILWSQLYKTLTSLENQLRIQSFTVLNSATWTDEQDLNVLLFELEQDQLPPIRKHLGPQVERRTESQNFLEKHLEASDTIAGPWIEDDRWIVLKTRKHVSARVYLENILRDGGHEVGVGSKISPVMKSGHKVLENTELLQLCRQSDNFTSFLLDFLRTRPSWLER